jgi:hypothetical protein
MKAKRKSESHTVLGTIKRVDDLCSLLGDLFNDRFNAVDKSNQALKASISVTASEQKELKHQLALLQLYNKQQA